MVNKSFSLILGLIMQTQLTALQDDALIIAHRGASQGTAENSLKAFVSTTQNGTCAVECDIRRCKSGELVLHHDELLSRVFKIAKQVEDLTLTELRAQAPQIATLADLFVAMPIGITIVLDLKETGIAQDLAAMITFEIQSHGRTLEQFYTTGWHHHEQVELKKILPGLRIVPAVVGTTYNLANYLRDMGAYGCCLVNLPGGTIIDQLVQDVITKGFKIWVYQPQGMPTCLIDKLPIVGLMTDTPINFLRKDKTS